MGRANTTSSAPFLWLSPYPLHICRQVPSSPDEQLLTDPMG